MGHAGNNLVLLIALGAAIGIPFYMLRRKRKVLGGFDAFVKQHKFTPRSHSPVAAFSESNPPEGLHFSSGYDGQLRPGVSMTLLLLRRMEAVAVQGVSIQNATLYFGVYLPDAAKFGPDFAKNWRDAAQRKQGNGVYAAPAREGGFIVVWKGAPSRQNVEARLAELTASVA